MAKRAMDEQAIEEWFMRADGVTAKCMLEKITLILRVRGIAAAEPRRGRPRKQTPKEGTETTK